jgi:peptidoglycan/xylan/chitin deacetylase (PgdA/CDA1 family)
LKRRYRLLSLADYLAARRDRLPLARNTAIVTFDDGLRNFLTLAAPLLAREAIPATMYLITGRLSSGKDLDGLPTWNPEDDGRFLSVEEVIFLQRLPGIDFGSHTCSHYRLDELEAAQVTQELRSSFMVMYRLVRAPERLTLAYPFGFSSPAIAEQASVVGYVAALTTDEGANDETTCLFGLRRVLIGDDDVLPVFAARVSGLLWMLKNLRKRLRHPLK